MIESTENVLLVMQALRLGIDPREAGWEALMLDRLRAVFEEDAHPTTPWYAFGLARRLGIPVPEWVMAYLDDRRTKLSDAVLYPREGESEAEAAGRALGFRAAGRGMPSPGSQALREVQAWLYVWELERERCLSEERGVPFKLAAGIAAVVARHNVSASTVRRAASVHGETVARQVAIFDEVFSQE